ncbi:thermonuclease family protein [Flavimaricola marinus]|nr:thermonuclease family protein [Flavimaricola marinus]
MRIETKLKAVVLIGLLGLVVLPGGSDLALTLVRPVQAEASTCRVTSITDGDTVRLWCPNGEGGPARLTGFDTPELFSPECPSEYAAALAAKWYLRQAIWGASEVRMVREGTDRYGRLLVAMELDGQPLRQLMIEAGHARPYAGGQRAGWCAA